VIRKKKFYNIYTVVPSMLSQRSLMFASKAKAYPSEAILQVLH